MKGNLRNQANNAGALPKKCLGSLYAGLFALNLLLGELFEINIAYER